MKTFFLLQADPGFAGAVAEHVANAPGVVSVAVTSGAYDVVAEVEVADDQRHEELRAIVRLARGLCRVCVCRVTA